MTPAAWPGGSRGWAGAGDTEHTLWLLPRLGSSCPCPSTFCREQHLPKALRAAGGSLRSPQLLAQPSMTGVPANAELPKNPEKHVLCLLGAACAPSATRKGLSGVCDGSTSCLTLSPFLGLLSCPLCPASCLLRGLQGCSRAPRSEVVARGQRGGRAGHGQRGGPRYPAHSGHLGSPTGICSG